MDDIAALEHEMYSEGEAARLLGVRQSTLHYWLEGRVDTHKVYKPVIRPEATGRRTVTWAEFIEAGLLREFRQTHRVPMIQLRQFIDDLRGRFGVPYPLAHQTPLVSGRQLVLEAQIDVGLGTEYCLIATANNQLLLTPAAEAFVERVTWADGIAGSWRPHEDRRSPVRIDPDVRFGRPAVGGVSTEAIWEQELSGLTTDELADMFDLTPTDVRWAVAYETSARAA